MNSQIKVSYRDIAKMLVKAMPVELEDFRAKVDDYLEIIKAMSIENKIALKSAYIFSSKVPREEREDLFQEIALTLLEAQTKDERLAYAVARCDWKNWWSKFRIRQHYSLDSVIDEESQTTLGDTLVGECEFDLKINGDIDGQALYSKLPSWIKALVDKSLRGFPIRGGERQLLNKWVASRPMILASYQS